MTLRVRPTRVHDVLDAFQFAQLFHGVRSEYRGEDVLRHVTRASVGVPLANALEHAREAFIAQRRDALSKSRIAVFVIFLEHPREHTQQRAGSFERQS